MKTAKEYFREHRLRYFHTLTKKQVIGLMESYAKEQALEFAEWIIPHGYDLDMEKVWNKRLNQDYTDWEAAK